MHAALAWLATLQLAGAAVFGLAALADAGLRRRSAAVRRGVWALAVAVALALPLTRLALGAPALAVDPGLAAVLLTAWALGALALLLRLARGAALARRLRRASRPLAHPAWRTSLHALDPHTVIDLRVSDDLRAPVTHGVLRPAILVPRDMLAADAAARRSVLAHELAHVARADALVFAAAAVARAVYWVSPLTWTAVRRLRARAEDAADDAVLHAGVPSSSYAAQLLAVARAQLARAGRVTAGGLRSRVHAVLDVRRVRGPARGSRWGLPRLVAAALLLATLGTACEARSDVPPATRR
jgi:beta-lactamase regulating signal transducer with metallopeptidase domain